MRKLLLENVSSVSEGSQVTLTWLTAQELDKIRIIKKKNRKSSFSLVYSQHKNSLESANQTGSHLLLSGWNQQQLCGAPDSVLENREGSPGRIRAKFWHLWL